jgi:hypothetical protein
MSTRKGSAVFLSDILDEAQVCVCVCVCVCVFVHIHVRE